MPSGWFRRESSTTDTLTIGAEGAGDWNVRGGRVLGGGELVGNISGTERVELRRTARVLGDVEAPVVVLEEGGLFEGHCRMTKVNPNAEATTTRDFSVVPLKR